MGPVVITHVQMRFSDIDSFGHVNNLAQQAYFDLGKVELFERVMALDNATAQVSAMLVSIHTDFLQQIYFGDELRVETEVESIGNKSITVGQRIMRGDTECARCRSVMVAYDKQQGVSIVVPDEWRKRIER